MEKIIKEKLIERSIIPVTIEKLQIIENQMINCVCKIHKNNGLKGTGFFCNIPIKEKKITLPMLITNYHILNENDLKKGKSITISLNNEKEFKKITIDNIRKVYFSQDLDISFIEIFYDEDKINNKFFLEVDTEATNTENTFLNDKFKYSSLYTLNYQKEGKIVVSFGIISEIKNNDIYHSCNTDYGASGSPILSLNNNKVIGIHFGNNKEKPHNIGTFIKYAISKFYKNLNIQQNNYDKRIIKERSFFNNKNFEFKDKHIKINSNYLITDKNNNVLRPKIDKNKKNLDITISLNNKIQNNEQEKFLRKEKPIMHKNAIHNNKNIRPITPDFYPTHNYYFNYLKGNDNNNRKKEKNETNIPKNTLNTDKKNLESKNKIIMNNKNITYRIRLINTSSFNYLNKPYKINYPIYKK